MNEVTRILSAIEAGDPQAASALLPIVYDELRRLAAARLAQETPGQTLDATGLVHEAYLRLVGEQRFENRRHFFAAAAEAMRRILIDQARHKKAVRQGGQWKKIDGVADLPGAERDISEAIAVHELIDRLVEKHGRQAEVAKLRFFLQCTFAEVGEILGLSADSAESDWAFARAWFRRELEKCN